MNAIAVIQTLLALGVQLKDAWTKSGQDWSTFLTSTDFQSIEGTVNELFASLQPSDLRNAIGALQQKEADLLNGRSLVELSVTELTQFHALSDVEHQLVMKLLMSPDQADFLSVLTNEVLPVLVQAAQIVIPLLT